MSERAIRELTKEFMEAYNRGDATAIGEMYTEDSKLLPPNMALLRGKQAIQDFWKMAMAMGMHANLETEEVDFDGDLGYDRGIITLTKQSKEDDTTTYRQKYLIVVKRHTDGSWKIAADIWNGNPA
jgi:uncharacterized protein (TIGR02246 family)